MIQYCISNCRYVKKMQRNFWNDSAEGWDEQPGVRDYAENVFKSLSAHFKLKSNQRVLDFGCGTGLLLEKLAPLVHQVVAVDSSKKMVETLSKKKIPNVFPLVIDLSRDTIKTEQLLSGGKFDLIVVASVFLFVKNYEDTLGLLKSLLTCGGKIVQWDWLASSAEGGFGLSEERVRTAYANCGMTLVAPISHPWQQIRVDRQMLTVLMAVGECRPDYGGNNLKLFNKCSLNRAAPQDVDDILTLEVASFPADEAANRDQVAERQRVAGDYFWIVRDSENPSQVLGFVNGTCINAEHIDHDCMSNHVADGRVLVIHSVTVSESQRLKGFGTAMLKDYVHMLKGNKNVDTVLLLCKAEKITFYRRCGFHVVMLSDVVHGADPWFEMKIDLVEARHVDQLTVDAFSFKPFSGNPAAVVFQHGEEDWMQQIAMENNYAETAFLSAVPECENEYHIRWFTPDTEIDLCGHATLASAHALVDTGRVTNRLAPMKFHTRRSGTLQARATEDGDIELNFPSTPPEAVVCTDGEKQALIDGFGLTHTDILFVGRSKFDMVVEVSTDTFKALLSRKVNIPAVAQIVCRGVIITSAGAAIPAGIQTSSRSVVQPDFCSRFFGPRVGVDEDHVTGSAHCALTPYWTAKLGKDKLIGYQASARGGLLNVALIGGGAGCTADSGARVLLSGKGVTTAKSKLMA